MASIIKDAGVNLATPTGEAATVEVLDGSGESQVAAAVVCVNPDGSQLAQALTDAQLRASAVAVSGPLTDAELRASAVAVSGPLTDTQLRASAVPVTGALTDAQLRASEVAVSISGVASSAKQDTGNTALASIKTAVEALPTAQALTDAQLRAAAVVVSGPLTDTQLRAAPLEVTIANGGSTSGGLTDTELRASPVPVSGPLTDTQLRATAIDVNVVSGGGSSGGLTDAELRASAVAVSGPLTDAELRATAVPVSVSGVATADKQDDAKGVLDTIAGRLPATAHDQPLTDTQLRATAVAVSGTFWQTTQPVSASSLPLPTGAATETTLSDIKGKIPAVGQAAAAASLPVIIASDQGSIPVTYPTFSSVVIMSLTTASTGTNWTAFTSQPCKYLDIVNATGTAIEYRRGSSGNAMTIPDGSSRMVLGITNANDVEIRRKDTSNTTVTVAAEAMG